MTDYPTKEISGSGAGVAGLLKAALPSIPGVNALPGVAKASVSSYAGLTYTRPPVTINAAHVKAYSDVCGFPVKDEVPLPYPHMLAFALHMGIMLDPRFPYPAIGTVHLANSITRHRAIRVGETLEVSASVAPPYAHAKGALLEFVTTVTADGDTVWESTSSYLRRGKAPQDAAPAPEGPAFNDVAPGTIPWKLPADLGRRYAAVSGDHNPIHLYPLTAKALGFPRQIAHGMWSKARCIAAIENRLPDAVRVDVQFRNPILLPGTVAFSKAESDGRIDFTLTGAKSGKTHLLGQSVWL
ncbi:MaoC family dehydratase [Nocardioides limicola]|uniref:MaoC family dehydratase n=1 Tax=Nocardioides limicola TaxID=2803368 RepID=UPI00193C75D0|nr:MaoC/PaaZ C-terminal domain-containing protein [Nocardioides sp. DJM-14]